jgi:hypothetical protein
MTTWMVLPPIVFGSVDSQYFASVFPLSSAGDLPPDFELAGDLTRFSFGVFLPLFETEPARPPHPPTAILLYPSQLVIAARDARPRIIPLSNLQYVEYGHYLLQGWIGFVTNGRMNRFPFNTLKRHAVDELMRRLTAAWAPENYALPASHVVPVVELDLKFRYAEAAALGPRETILTRFFSRTRMSASPVLDGRPPHRNAGGYLAITSRRLLWITERNRGCYEPYGSILRFAPLKNLTDIFVHSSGRNSGLFCRLKSGTLWYIPLESQGIDGGCWFADQAHQIIRPASPNTRIKDICSPRNASLQVSLLADIGVEHPDIKSGGAPC